jgi:hypothetical protein
MIVNNFTPILLSFAYLLSVVKTPTSELYSCGKSKSCCKMMINKGCKKKCCCLKDFHIKLPDSKHKKCGGSCDGKGCPCPQSSSNTQIGNITSQFDLSVSICLPFFKTLWYYVQRFQPPVFLALWLKPKITYIIFA